MCWILFPWDIIWWWCWQWGSSWFPSQVMLLTFFFFSRDSCILGIPATFVLRPLFLACLIESRWKKACEFVICDSTVVSWLQIPADQIAGERLWRKLQVAGDARRCSSCYLLRLSKWLRSIYSRWWWKHSQQDDDEQKVLREHGYSSNFWSDGIPPPLK